MGNFVDLTKKLHNFEISQMHQESYVQYLHLLSCVSLNCTALQGNDPKSFAQANTEFLVQNIEHLSEIYVREDHRKRLLNNDLQGQRTMLYQFFFVVYLLSISTVQVVKASAAAAVQEPSNSRSVAQRIYTILMRILEALSDTKLN